MAYPISTNAHQLTVFIIVGIANPLIVATSISTIHSTEISYVSKSWMAYLTHSLQKELYHGRQELVQHLREIRKPISYMINWCEPPLTNTNELDSWTDLHMYVWVPCGYGLIHMNNHGMKKKMFCVMIKVNPIFYLSLMFIKFEMCDSGAACLHSSLNLMKLNNVARKWVTFAKFCGYRDPWNVTLDLSTLVLCISQYNVYRLNNITFKYISISRAVDLHQEPNTTNLVLTSSSEMLITHNDNSPAKWMLKVEIGCVLRFERLKLLGPAQNLEIFDGVKTLFPVFMFDEHRNDVIGQEFERFLNVSTQYFESHVLFIIDTTIFNSKVVMSLIFRRVILDPKPLHLNTITRVRSQHQITHVTFSLSPEGGKFPNVLFRIRQFQGFNWGGCNFGGYAFKQYVNHPIVSPNMLGPFCSTTSPNHSYTSPHYLSEFGFSSDTTHLILYSYSIMYVIDMDIERGGSSRCEGILDPILMWFSNRSLQKTLDKDVVAFNHTSMALHSMHSNESVPLLHIIKFLHLSSCLVLQSVSFAIHTSISHTFTMPTRGDFTLRYYKPPEYHPSLYRQKHGYMMMKFRRPYDDTPWIRNFNETLTVDVYDVSIVDISQYTGAEYDFLTYIIKLIPLSRKDVCSEDDIRSYHFLHESIPNAFHSLTYNNCGLQLDDANVTYFFVLISKLQTNYQSSPIWYLEIHKHMCRKPQESEDYDVLTTRLTVDRFHTTSHSVNLIKDLFYIQTQHSMIGLVYQRRQICSSVFIHYRDVPVKLFASYLFGSRSEIATIQVRYINGTQIYVSVKYEDSLQALVKINVYNSDIRRLDDFK